MLSEYLKIRPKEKKLARVEAAGKYIEMIRASRDPLFTIFRQEEFHTKDFKNKIKQNIKLPKNLKISEAVKIVYHPDRSIDM